MLPSSSSSVPSFQRLPAAGMDNNSYTPPLSLPPNSSSRPRLCRDLTSPDSFTLLSGRYKLPVQLLVAQARRSISSMAKEEEEAASPSDLQFEGPLKIVEYPDPVLRAKNKRVNTFDESLKNLADQMFDVMNRNVNTGCWLPFSTELMAMGSQQPKLGSMFSLSSRRTW